MPAGVPTEPTARLAQQRWPQLAVCFAAAALVVLGIGSAQLLGASVDWPWAVVATVFFIVSTGLATEWAPPSRERAAAPSRIIRASVLWLAAFGLLIWLVGGQDAGLGSAWGAGIAASAAFSLAGSLGMRVRRREPVELTDFTGEGWEPVTPRHLRWGDADVLLVIPQQHEQPYANVRLASRLQGAAVRAGGSCLR